MPGVFISYRRDDRAESAHRVADDLRRKFGHRQVFVDVDNTPRQTVAVETM